MATKQQNVERATNLRCKMNQELLYLRLNRQELTLRPAPILEEEPIFSDWMLINNASKAKNHEAMKRLNKMFRKECHYDFPQWYSYDPKIFGFLLNHLGLGLGAVGFYQHEDVPHLQWAWLHPFIRSRGIFAEFWGHLMKDYSNLKVEGPLSASMKHFLRNKIVEVV